MGLCAFGNDAKEEQLVKTRGGRGDEDNGENSTIIVGGRPNKISENFGINSLWLEEAGETYQYNANTTITRGDGELNFDVCLCFIYHS